MGTNMADNDLGLTADYKKYGSQFCSRRESNDSLPVCVKNSIVLTDQESAKAGTDSRVISDMTQATNAVQKPAPDFKGSALDTLPVVLGGKGLPASVNHTGVIGHGGQPLELVGPEKTVSSWAQDCRQGSGKSAGSWG